MKTGIIQKMNATIEQGIVRYSLQLGDDLIDMNSYIGKEITLNFTGEIYCIKCGRKTNKSFSQGYCYPCFTTAPETEECVLRPELCRAHEGIARDMEFAKNHCLIPHYVYLAETSDLKVGITRNTQIPTRWIDQGATQATIIAETPNRYTAGAIEVALKQFVADKTNWRKMLTKKCSELDLLEEKSRILEFLPKDFEQYIKINTTIQNIEYPGILPSSSINSIKFDTNPQITNILQSIKGQYLIFQNNTVINLRSHSGYKISAPF
jgi:hypothetical protein